MGRRISFTAEGGQEIYGYYTEEDGWIVVTSSEMLTKKAKVGPRAPQTNLDGFALTLLRELHQDHLAMKRRQK